jgi:hypothetical protein
MSSNEEAQERRSRELREQVERLKRGEPLEEGDEQPPPSPREFIHRKMRKHERASESPADGPERQKADADDSPAKQ